MPMDVAIRYARLPHGLTYLYQHWLPEHPKGLTVIVHGLGDHIGRYHELVARLTSEGMQ